jgi:menaquinone-dependent protoporphyrinogen oxidase
MNILVTVTSRHASTREIGEAIADELRLAGHSVEFVAPHAVRDLSPYGAVVVGSGLYMGKWLAEGRGFVERHQSALAGLPVWLFSSGPLGKEHSLPSEEAKQPEALRQRINGRGHRTFAGKLDPLRIGLGERLILRMVKAPAGDFRDWAAIRAWAREIAASLAVPVA